MTHFHSFDEKDWPFDVPVRSPAYSTKNIVRNGYPILTIAHDHEGEWQFLCGTVDDPKDMSIVCLGCMYELHPFIMEFSELPRGHLAWRDSENDEWFMDEMEE